MEETIETQEELYLTKILAFIRSDEGKYLVSLIDSSYKNRLNDLIYANKDDVFECKGEVKAYIDILEFLKENTIIALRKKIIEENN